MLNIVVFRQFMTKTSKFQEVDCHLRVNNGVNLPLFPFENFLLRKLMFKIFIRGDQ